MRVSIIASALAGLSMLGCATSASEACEEHRAAINGAAARCGFTPYPEAWLVWASGPCEGMTTTCAYISEVKSPNDLYVGCIPYFEETSCEELSAGPTPEYCDDLYEGPSSDLVTCRPID
jgi:hypothetical protein